MQKLEHNFDEINDINEKIIFLKNELDLIKDLNNKTKEFLLLEIESNLDKQNQVQIKQNKEFNSFKEIIHLLKKEINDNIDSISKLNEEIGKYIAKSDIDVVVLCGKLMNNAYTYLLKNSENKKLYYFDELKTLLSELDRILENDDTILVKASHGMEFSKIISCIKWLHILPDYNI